MQASQWIEIIQRVPVEFHTGLAFMMNNGLEIVLEVVIRLDDDFIMCRGRATGSTDAGMTFFIPYDQIACLTYTKMLKLPVTQAWFPEPSPHAVPTRAAPEAAPIEEPQEQVDEEQPEPAPAAKPAAGAPRPGAAPARPATPPQRPMAPQPAPLGMPGMPMPAKAAMIERLRKRAQDGPKSPEQK